MANNHEHIDELALLPARIAQGDTVAFEMAFRHYFHPIYLVMLRYTHRHSDAEDIVQHVFVNCWEKRHLLTHVDRFDKWLFTAALNEFRTRFRKNRRDDDYRQFLKDSFNEEDTSPEDQLIFKQKEGLLCLALDQLSPRQRQAFLLSREEGLTYAEIAATMDLEPATVKEHISRALRSIKSFILSQNNEFLVIPALLLQFFFN